ncbi:MAG: hypothetical protein MI866_05240 [Bacteroidales bacterium]|nr:hypothetical protein [Bacteroidales bacterium]
MKKIIPIIVLALMALACNNQTPETENRHQASTNQVTETLLATESSNYSKIFNEGPLAGYTGIKENPLASYEVMPLLHEDAEQLKSQKVVMKLYANGVELSNVNRLKSANGLGDAVNDLYGKKVRFTLRKEGALKSGEMEQEESVEMYIPELVEILSPPIHTAQELYPFCYYKDFTIKWNADSQNEHGLVVLVEWMGTMLSDEDDYQEYVRNIDVIKDDNGVAVLNNKLFEKIPERALCYITLLRGNIEMVDIDEVSYRVLGESHAVLPCVLIRELN